MRRRRRADHQRRRRIAVEAAFGLLALMIALMSIGGLRLPERADVISRERLADLSPA